MATSNYEFRTISKHCESLEEVFTSISSEPVFNKSRPRVKRNGFGGNVADGPSVDEPPCDATTNAVSGGEEWREKWFLFLAVCGKQGIPKQREEDKKARRQEIDTFIKKYKIRNFDVEFSSDPETTVNKLQELFNRHREKRYLRFIFMGHGTKIEVQAVSSLRTGKDAIPNSDLHEAVGNTISDVQPESKGNIDVHFFYCYAKDGPKKDLQRRYSIFYSSDLKPKGIFSKDGYDHVAENFALKELGETLTKEAENKKGVQTWADSTQRGNEGTSEQTILYTGDPGPSSVNLQGSVHNSTECKTSQGLAESESSSLSKNDVLSFSVPPAIEVESPSGSTSDPPFPSGGATENASVEGSNPAASGLPGSGADLNDPADVPDIPVDVLDACPNTGGSAARATLDQKRVELDRMRKENNRKQKENEHMKRQSIRRSLTASQESSTNVQIHHPPAASSGDAYAAGAQSSTANGRSGPQSVRGLGESERRLHDLDSQARGEKVVEETSEYVAVVPEGAVASGGDDRIKQEGAVVDTNGDRVNRLRPKKQRFKSVFSCLFRRRDKHK